MKTFFTKWVSTSKKEKSLQKPKFSQSVINQPKIEYFGDEVIINDYIKHKDQNQRQKQKKQGGSTKQMIMKKKINKQFYQNLLNLEEQIQNNKYDIQTLAQLIPFYATLVEVYDADSDPISFYFMEKIQNLLTLQQSLQLIYQNDGTPLKEDKYKKEEIADVSVIHRNKKKQRATKMKMFMEYKDTTKETNVQMKVENLVTDYQQVEKHNRMIIDQDLNQQLSRVNQRLEKRKLRKTIKHIRTRSSIDPTNIGQHHVDQLSQINKINRDNQFNYLELEGSK